jgi:hypothetical protein
MEQNAQRVFIKKEKEKNLKKYSKVHILYAFIIGKKKRNLNRNFFLF